MAPVSRQALRTTTTSDFTSAPSPDKWLGKSGSLRKSVSSQGVVPLRDSRNSRQVSACEAVFSVAYATCGIRLWACCGRLGGSIFV